MRLNIPPHLQEKKAWADEEIQVEEDRKTPSKQSEMFHLNLISTKINI